MQRFYTCGIACGNSDYWSAYKFIVACRASCKRSGPAVLHCCNNLRQIGIALKMYADANQEINARAFDGTNRWMTVIQPFVQNYEIFRCPTAPDIKDGYSGLNLGYGMNVYDFKDGYDSFWYHIKDKTVAKTTNTIWIADCSELESGCYWVGTSSPTFKDPVPYVDYRHSDGFCALFYDCHCQWLKQTTKSQWSIDPDD